jgi:hypothetical protein
MEKRKATTIGKKRWLAITHKKYVSGEEINERRDGGI